MAETVFDKILLKGIRQGRVPGRTKAARAWFRKMARGTKVNTSNLLKEKDRKRGSIEIGRMYHFVYDPKHKATLPYYDKFPLIFPMNFVLIVLLNSSMF